MFLNQSSYFNNSYFQVPVCLDNKRNLIGSLNLPNEFLLGHENNLSIEKEVSVYLEIFDKYCLTKKRNENLSYKIDNLNKLAMTLVTRFKKYKKASPHSNGLDIQVDPLSKKPIVQFLAFKKYSDKTFWMIPSGFLKTQRKTKHSNILKDKNCLSKKKSKLRDESVLQGSQFRKIYQDTFINSRIIYNGYMNGSLTDSITDKSIWHKVIVENCHHYSEKYLKSLNDTIKMLNLEGTTLKWIDLYDKQVYPPHKAILKKCANFLNSKWED
jgi:hypothetical protein